MKRIIYKKKSKFNLNFNVMKKIVFNLMAAFVLTLIAGSAHAQLNNTPYPGGSYSYSLSGIKVDTEGTLTIAYSGNNATITNVNLTETGVGTGIYVVPNTTTTLTFDIDYDDDATDGTLSVTVTDGAADGCSNFIELDIDVQVLPTLALSILASEDQYCQNLKTVQVDNEAASVDAPDNSFTFTVTPTVSNVSTAYTYNYAIALPSPALTGYSIAYSGPGSYAAGVVTGADSETDGVFTITFETTTGIAPVDITGTLSSATLTVTSGGGTYTGTYSPASDAVNVKTMPSIGTFTIE
jgi:hypothetical protein